VTIADVNHPPSIDASTPTGAQQQVLAGSSLAFTVAASDPDGDAVSVQWFVDFSPAGSGSSFTYSPGIGALGAHVVRAEASDGNVAGGTVAHEWSVAVVAPDADGDGWNANVDCNDGNPNINPGHAEIIGNGIDDDCNPATLDGGTPPVAAFSSAPALGLVGQPVQFTDLSTDPDSPIASWAWTFGDGGTSSLPNPSHVYAAAGTFTVHLTVTDPGGLSSGATHTVNVTHAPTAGFSFAPNPAVRNSSVQFTDTSVDLDGPIASRSWQFGDSGTSVDANPVHTYPSVGTYSVILTVTDGSGVTASVTQSVTVAAAPDDPTALRLVLLETNCNWAVTYTFSVGGVQIATLVPAYDCTCGPPTKTLTITDPAILNLITSPVCQTFEMTSNAASYVGWARVEIVRAGGVQTIRIVNTNPGDGPEAYSTQVCNGYAGARAFQSVLPDMDLDGTPDCTDPDIDGDGVLNASDNCPTTANPGQADFNHDGIGDACQDSDGDTVLDAVDNCKVDANTRQFDFDNDGIGNACDDDIDGDGVLNGADNCPYIANADQADANGDGHGDVCDISEMRILAERSTQGYPTTLRISVNGTQIGTMPPPLVDASNCSPAPTVLTITDPELLAFLGTVPSCNAFRIVADNQMLMSWSKAELTHRSGSVETVVISDLTSGNFQNFACYQWDNALTYQNPTPDTDSDGILDCKDPDLDGDGVLNAADNCPYVPNPGQADVDHNGIGNACQDTDHDGVLDINDNCPLVANANQANIDGDAFGDVCDADMDNDGVPNGADNCPTLANTDQANYDGDSMGDVCDPDIDNDGVANGSDNCVYLANPDQLNRDGDSVGDACDPDMDNDGVLNAADNCPLTSNASQAMTNAYGVGDACVPIPITVPWLGVPTQPHQVFDGGALILQGVAVLANYTPADITAATWDPGDGTGPVPVSIANPLALELAHTYSGANNTPYTAVLEITMLNGAKRTDTFRVLIQPRTIDVEANMAIDRGLWNLHKTLTRTTVGAGVPAAYWSGSYDTPAASASTAQAFLINNHREIGNRMEDPYVDDVTRGLRYLEIQLSAFGIGAQPAGDPDTNHNGIGLQYASQPVYATGQIADAFVATGTPGAVAVGGDATWVRGRTYRDLVQDMMDAYWWGQVDPGNWARGGWHYGFNYGSADNSTAQWGAITGLAGENAWNIPVPAFVKAENLGYWLKYSQNMNAGTMNGSLGYMDLNPAWSNGMATTPSGLVQMDFDGVRNDPTATTDDEVRFQAGVRFMARAMRANWHLSDPSWGSTNMYSLFALAKAFRLATGLDAGANVIANPVVMINDDPSDPSRAFDWYRSDPGAGGTAPIGVARLLISRQIGDGSWSGGNSYWNGPLATSYAVIILSPTIFELGPAAVCSALPSTVGTGDAVSFDGSGSFHNDPFGTIASYAWNFQDGSATVTNAAPTTTTSHTFGSLGTFNVQLTVADQNGITATSSCPVNVIAGNLPPVARPGGPYNFCAGGPMVLNGTSSSDPEGSVLTFAWDLSSPLTFASAEGTTGVFDVTAALASFGPGTYQIGLRVTDDHALSNAVFPNITIHPAGDPAFCNTAPTLTLPPNVTTPATSAAGAAVSYTATAADAQDGAIAPACVPPSGSTFPIGPTTVTCAVTDSGGLSASGSFTVTVTNNAPTFAPPANISTPATSAAGAVVTFTATGSDVEDGTLAAVCVPPSGSTFPIGPTTVNCAVTDSGGLSASGSFTVTVTVTRTNVPPTFTPPANISTPATSAAGAAVSFSASGNDAEDGVIAAVCVPPSGSTFPIGPTTVNCTVTDTGGLTASGSFTVTVTAVASACVTDLAARPKSGKIQLTWTSTGVDHYNVYRGAISGGPYLMIASTTSLYSTYLDQTVVNGTMYYYIVRPALITDAETCQSNQAMARPTAR